ncbi:Exportin-1 [Stylophora pistillata]|uniref:Exportin-1 n=1 Tax=Stylophora pistillata TaxID=50429 RepID=A0A2B4SJU6_STYPI|nr:Exportin-1 [Stylophora pistillata]
MPTAMATIEHATQLLDFTQKLDITLLDSVVSCFYMAQGPQQRMADQILTQLKQHPDAWTRVDTILEFSNNQQTKYFALQILESVIKTRWKVLPSEQCEGIKKYMVGLIIKISSEGDMLEKEKTYIGKLNMILVEILKHEWPKKWPSFMGDIVGASKANESLCQNNMVILKLLSEEVFDFSSGQMTQTKAKHLKDSEEVFDFSSGQMTQTKAKHLKDSMCSEFLQIFTLCQFVLGNSQNVTLIGATLETLLRFLNWIPLGYIFETQLNSTLVCKDSVVMERLIEKYMSLPNQAWDNIVKEAKRNIDHLREIEVVKQLGNILKTNVQGCKSIGHPFVTQLGRIYLDMLNVYRCLSENISVAIAENGEIVTKQPLIRAMRTVKTESLRLISTWVSKSNDAMLVCDNFIPPLLDAVLGDYQRNVPNAREPEVLSTMATFVNKLEHVLSVVTDTSHTAGLTMHATILAHMFSLVESGKVSEPLFAAEATQYSSNQAYVQECIANLLKQAFPHLQHAQIKLTVQGLFDLNQNIPAFKEHLRDFMVQIKEYRGEDVTDLYLDERDQQLKSAQEEKRKVQLSVPGIVNPHDVPEEMQD